MTILKPAPWPFPVKGDPNYVEPEKKAVPAPLAWPFPTPGIAGTPKITQYDEHDNRIDPDLEDEDNGPPRDLYLVEVICGGVDAAGGGCGGPMDLYSVSKDVFSAVNGSVYDEIQEHNSDEHNFDENRVHSVKLQFRACSCCRRMS